MVSSWMKESPVICSICRMLAWCTEKELCGNLKGNLRSSREGIVSVPGEASGEDHRGWFTGAAGWVAMKDVVPGVRVIWWPGLLLLVNAVSLWVRGSLGWSGKVKCDI